MKIEKIFLILLILCLAFPFVLAGGIHSAKIPQEYCSITCTNDFTGEEHTISGDITGTVYADGYDDAEVIWNVYYDNQLTYTKTVGGQDSEEHRIVMPDDPGTPNGIISFWGSHPDVINDLIALAFKSSISFKIYEGIMITYYNHYLDFICFNNYIRMGATADYAGNTAKVWCSKSELDKLLLPTTTNNINYFYVICDDCDTLCTPSGSSDNPQSNTCN